MRPVSKYQQPAAVMGLGKKAAGREDAEAEGNLPEAGEHPHRPWNEANENNRNECAGADGGKELFDGHEDHFVGHAGVDAAGAGESLHADEGGGEDGGGDPDAQVVADVIGGIGQQQGLRDSSADRRTSRWRREWQRRSRGIP